MDHVFASSLFVPYIKNMQLDDMVIAAPDMGGTKRANAYSRFLDTDMVICYKQRKKANHIEDLRVIGDVEGKNVVIVDDMVDTAGTLTLVADMMMGQGAKSVRACATHPVLSGPAYERIENSSLAELVVSNSINDKYGRGVAVKKILNIPKAKKIDILISMGYPKNKEIRDKTRKPLEQIRRFYK